MTRHASVEGEFHRLQATDVQVLAARCDVAERTQICQLMHVLSLSPVGVWHASGVLADALLDHLNTQALVAACAPKAFGVWNVHACVFRAVSVRTFALFGSVAALFGSAGQANYAAANAFLDELASCRRAQSVVAVSVQWGAWADMGMAARGAARDRMAVMQAESGWLQIDWSLGLTALATAVQHSSPSVLSVRCQSAHVPVRADAERGRCKIGECGDRCVRSIHMRGFA
jgi:hypothetical protein